MRIAETKSLRHFSVARLMTTIALYAAIASGLRNLSLLVGDLPLWVPVVGFVLLAAPVTLVTLYESWCDIAKIALLLVVPVYASTLWPPIAGIAFLVCWELAILTDVIQRIRLAAR